MISDPINFKSIFNMCVTQVHKMGVSRLTMDITITDHSGTLWNDYNVRFDLANSPVRPAKYRATKLATYRIYENIRNALRIALRRASRSESTKLATLQQRARITAVSLPASTRFPCRVSPHK